MAQPTFPFSGEELNRIGALGKGVPKLAADALEMMRTRPDLLTPSLWALQCVIAQGHQYKGPSSPTLPGSPTISESSNKSALTLASDTTVASKHSPTAYEKQFYYNGITGDSDCPGLIYRSDYYTTPFAKPTGRFGQVPVKSVHGVSDTPLNAVWGTVGPQIRDIVKAHGVRYSSIDTARFYTHGPPGEKGSLGPPVVWMGVRPGSTSADTAHDVSQAILTLLEKNEVTGVVVEWREAVVQRLAGPPLLRSTDTPQ